MSANNLLPSVLSSHSSQLPSQIEPFKWAEQCFSWSGQVPLSRFARIASEVDGSVDPLAVTVDCRLFKDQYQTRVVWVDASLATTLPLVCQRCLDRVEVSLSTQVHLALVTDAAHAANLDEDADFVVLGEEQVVHGTDDSHAIDLIELLEDELLLCMPISPRHESCENRHQPVIAEKLEPLKRDNPFEVLANLKGKLDS